MKRQSDLFHSKEQENQSTEQRESLLLRSEQTNTTTVSVFNNNNSPDLNINKDESAFRQLSGGRVATNTGKTIRLLEVNQDALEHLKLRGSIEALTLDAEHQPVLLKALANAREQYKLLKISENASLEIRNLLNQIKLPHLLWDSETLKVVNSQLNHKKKIIKIDTKTIQKLFVHISTLNKQIQEIINRFQKDYPKFVNEMQSIMKEYFLYMQTFASATNEQRYTMLSDKPATITAFGIGTRLLKPEVVEKILPTNSAGEPYRTQDKGGHVVNFFQNVFYKVYPHAPGIEYLIGCINKLVCGQGSPPTLLLSVQKNGRLYSVLASQGVPGKTVEELFTESPDFLQQIDKHNYTVMMVLGLLGHHQDAKPLNYIGSRDSVDEKEKIIVSNIDH